MNINTEWKNKRADLFWSEVAATDHVLQVYEDENVFMNTLAGFVGAGINAGDSCIIIATKEHLQLLESRLKSYGVHVDSLLSENRYFPEIAEELLEKFMVGDMPDAKLFEITLESLLKKARGRGRKVRAFGEMVGILLKQGNVPATIRLEQLWDEFSHKHSLSLLCAYQKNLFHDDKQYTLYDICCNHSKMISGVRDQLKEVMYCDLSKVSSSPVMLQNNYLKGGLSA